MKHFYTIRSHLILFPPIASHFILSYLSYPILSYPFLSCPILSYPILSYPILSYPILSYPILSYPIKFPSLSVCIHFYTKPYHICTILLLHYEFELQKETFEIGVFGLPGFIFRKVSFSLNHTETILIVF